ncbi:MAG: dihydrofolate reductase [Hylemonella sp.]|uniref:dihydrofolate reductase n=1 Tax=Hylemonella sp. TaxID=2066020 RepID=UPI00391C058C
MKLHLIFARAANGAIGKNGTMPWHLPEDLAHFKRTTMGAPVIMGRKTWESLPPRFRPLPGRTNVVVTRQRDWQAAGTHVAHSLDEALQLCGEVSDAWIIGGAEIYAQALPLASTAVVTEIEAEFEGDAFAPQFGAGWQEVGREAHVSATGLKFSFVTYTHTPGV